MAEPRPSGAAAPEPGQPLLPREQALCNGISPWLAPLAMVLTQDLVLPAWFERITVLGGEHLPRSGAVLLAPTHRSRWDALLLPRAAGRRVSGRDCRFMVTKDEMMGLQGWFLHRLGCFPVDQGRPTLASLRYALDLLAHQQQLVVFPEGGIRGPETPIRLQQGLARLALLASGQGVPVTVVPAGIAYGHAQPRLGDRAAFCFAEPLHPSGQGREAARSFNTLLAQAMRSAEQAARTALEPPGLAP